VQRGRRAAQADARSERRRDGRTAIGPVEPWQRESLWPMPSRQCSPLGSCQHARQADSAFGCRPSRISGVTTTRCIDAYVRCGKPALHSGTPGTALTHAMRMFQAPLLTPADARPHRLSIVATADDMATTGSLLRPQPLTVSIERITGTATGGCITAGKPVVELRPAPRLRVPIAPTQHALLPGLPRAQGCLSLVFNIDDASTVFRQVTGTPCSLSQHPSLCSSQVH
jgi:hypothetical protein